MKKIIVPFILFFSLLGNIALGQSPIDSLLKLERTAHDTIKCRINNEIAELYTDISPDSVIKYANQALILAQKYEKTLQIIKAYENLNYAFYLKGDYKSAVLCLNNILKIAESKNDSNLIGQTYIDLGVNYKISADYNKALEMYQQALKIAEKRNNSSQMAVIYANIGGVYFYFGDNKHLSIEYYKKAYDLFVLEKDTLTQGQLLNNIGTVYMEWKKNDLALEYYLKALKLFEFKKEEANYILGSTYSNIANIYLEKGDFNKAMNYCDLSLKTNKELDNQKEIVGTYRTLALVYGKQKDFLQSFDYFEKSINLAKELGLEKEFVKNYQEYSDVLAISGNYKKSLDMYRIYSDLRDSVFSEKQLKQISEMEAKYQSEKKEQQIKLQESEIKKNALQRNFFIAGFLLMIALAVVIFRSYKQKQRDNNLLNEKNHTISEQNVVLQQAKEEIMAQNELLLVQKEEIEANRDEIQEQKNVAENQRDKIAHQQKEITDSIKYASRIQRAVLPPVEAVAEVIPNHFILWRPRDIVSGDFYWMKKVREQIYIVAADCTGHGVPGAFMSMLGITFLNEITATEKDLTANEVLNQLRIHIKTSLRQTGKEGEQKDGMDIALCIVNLNNMKLQYSGANNPLYLIKPNSEESIESSKYFLQEFKADKMPIGVYVNEKESFTNHEIDLMPDMSFYIASDGYEDQFGGPKGRKFLSKNFKELLVSLQEKTMNEQHNILNTTLENWRGTEYEQLDDILVIGVKI